ncbi:MAG: CvpA family protein [Clostridia bacterium]|nr:CvpA family protein [Clostridia bacterium]
MNLAVDLILISILLASAFYGYRKGFILSFFNFFGGLIGFVLSSFLAKPLGSYISDSFLHPFLSNYVSDTFSNFLTDRATETGNFEVLTSAMDFFHKFGLDQEALQNIFQNSENDVDRFIHSAIEAVSYPLADSVGYGIALILLSVLLFFLFKFIVKLFDLIAKLPVLNFANRSLGLVFGISYGILLSILFSSALLVLEPFLQNSDLSFFTVFSVEKTYAVKYFSSVLKNYL